MSSLGRSAARGTLMLMGGHACLTLSGYVIAILLARGLGPTKYGIYGLIYSFLLGVELISRFGIPQALSKLAPEKEGAATATEATAITLTGALYLGTFVAFWLAAPVLADLFNVTGGAPWFRIAALDIPVFGMYFVLSQVLNGRRDFGQQAVGVGLYGLTKLAAVSAIYLFGLTVSRALLANVIGSVVAATYFAFRVGRRPFQVTLAEWRPLVALAVPVGLFFFGSQILLNLDLWALNAVGEHLSEDVKGHYVAATNVAKIPNVVAFVMTAVLIPSVAEGAARGGDDLVEDALTGTGRFLAITLIPASALIAVEAEGIMELLFSSSYGAGAPLLAILIFSHGVLYTLITSGCSILIAIGEARVAALAVVGTLPLAFGAETLLIHLVDAPGAALGALAAMSTAVVLVLVLLHRRVASLRLPPGLLPVLAATCLVVVAAALVPAEGLALVAEAVALGGLYLVVVQAMGAFSWREVGDLLADDADGEER